MTEVKKQTTKYTIIAAAVCAVISQFVFGPGILFPYGLAVGVCVSLVNLSVISSSIERAVARGKKAPVIIGFFIRLVLYAGAFWFAVRTGGVSGLGAAVGFLLPRATLHIRYGFLPWLRQKTGKEAKPVYITDTRCNIFDKEPRFVIYNKGRSYLTHRHFRKIRVAPEEADEQKRTAGAVRGKR